jgi:hypothetical protein
MHGFTMLRCACMSSLGRRPPPLLCHHPPPPALYTAPPPRLVFLASSTAVWCRHCSCSSHYQEPGAAPFPTSKHVRVCMGVAQRKGLSRPVQWPVSCYRDFLLMRSLSPLHVRCSLSTALTVPTATAVCRCRTQQTGCSTGAASNGYYRSPDFICICNPIMQI